jgi:RecA-family ATPase
MSGKFTPLQGINYLDFLQQDVKPVEYLVDPIIQKSGLAYCYGPPGSFKTNFLMYASMMGADGQDILDYKVKAPFKTLWIDEENRTRGMFQKLGQISKGATLNNPQCLKDNHVVTFQGFSLLTPESNQRLTDAIERYHPDLIIMDSIAKVFPLDERNEKQVAMIYGQLGPLIEKYDISFVLIHHMRKRGFDQRSRGMEDMSGSREFEAMADTMFQLEQVAADEYMLKHTKSRYGSLHPAVNFNVTGDKSTITVNYKGLTKDKYRKKTDAVVDKILEWKVIVNKPTFERREVFDAMLNLDFKETSIKTALKELIVRGELQRTATGRYEWISFDDLVEQVMGQ